MTPTTMTGQQFNRDASGARRAAAKGPVFITDRGRPAHVLLTIEDYQSLAGPQPSIAELLAMPGGEDIEFNLPPRQRDTRSHIGFSSDGAEDRPVRVAR